MGHSPPFVNVDSKIFTKMTSRHAIIAAPVGLHARPATQFAQRVVAAGLPISVGRPGGTTVNAASVLAVMALSIRCGEEVVLTSKGPDAGHVLDDLVIFLETIHDAADDFFVPRR